MTVVGHAECAGDIEVLQDKACRVLSHKGKCKASGYEDSVIHGKAEDKDVNMLIL